MCKDVTKYMIILILKAPCPVKQIDIMSNLKVTLIYKHIEQNI